MSAHDFTGSLSRDPHGLVGSHRLTLTVGFGLQVAGLVTDSLYHAAHPHEATSPLWAHVPAYVGIVVILVGLVSGAIPRFGLLSRVALLATSAQVAAIVWSVTVQAEKNKFYVPVAIAVVSGAVAFATLVVVPTVRTLRTRKA